MTKQTVQLEPDFATACGWWADLPNIWTPVGWKDHLFRFSILWNGAILAQPHLNRRTTGWEGQGVQLALRDGCKFDQRCSGPWGGGKISRAGRPAL